MDVNTAQSLHWQHWTIWRRIGHYHTVFTIQQSTKCTCNIHNTAWSGSAVFITLSLFYSFQFLLPQTNLRFLNSHAERFGSAVYYLLPVENYMVRTTTSCFMTMLFLPLNLTLEDSGVSVDFINNTALQAGDSMYGTPIDREVCTTVTV